MEQLLFAGISAGVEENAMTGREIIEPTPSAKRYARREDKGHFTEDQTDVGKSSAADQRQPHLP